MQYEMEMDIAAVLFILERHLHNQRKVKKYNIIQTDVTYTGTAYWEQYMVVDIAYEMG